MADETPSLREAREVLGVTAAATPAEVVSAFRHQARVEHPDVSHARSAPTRFSLLVAAYRVALRAAHDGGTADAPRHGPVASDPSVSRPLDLVPGSRGTVVRDAGRPILVIGPVVTHPPSRGGGHRWDGRAPDG